MKKIVLAFFGSVIAASVLAAPDAPPPPAGGAKPCTPPACKPVTDADKAKQAKAAEILKNTKGNKTAAQDDKTMVKAKSKAEAPKTKP
jgi:hypothetical protein